MWGLKGVEEGLSIPFPPLVCGPPGAFFDVMLCEFRDRDGWKWFAMRKVPELQKRKIHNQSGWQRTLEMGGK